jgi:transcriptional regulator with XRE-family HTH domain
LRPLEGVRDLRERRMLSQQELAERAGVSLFTIQRIERGEGSVRPKTGRAIASALGVGVEELIAFPKAPSPRAPRLSEEERRQLAEKRRPQTDAWKKAVDDARRFRSSAKERLIREISAWRSAKEVDSSEEKRRPHLDEMGRILQEAYDVETALIRNVAGVVGSEWNTEVPATSELYRELFGMVEEAGLGVKPVSTSEGQFDIEEAAAA